MVRTGLATPQHSYLLSAKGNRCNLSYPAYRNSNSIARPQLLGFDWREPVQATSESPDGVVLHPTGFDNDPGLGDPRSPGNCPRPADIRDRIVSASRRDGPIRDRDVEALY